MQINESVKLSHDLIDQYHAEYLELHNASPSRFPIQVTDKRSNVFFKFLAEKLMTKEHDPIDRYKLSIDKSNERYARRVDSINTLKSKAMAIISKDKSEVKIMNVYEGKIK